MSREKRLWDITPNEELVNGKKVFVAHCLNLGIASQGYIYEESIENIKDAIRLCLEECPEKDPKDSKNLK